MGKALETRYPILLVHGLLGFVRLPGHSYWNGIDVALRRQGAAVYPVRLSGVHDNEALGEQLLERIAAIRAASGARRVNLLGHSQGGLSARYAAARRPDWVASVTTVATPNQGSEVADRLRHRVPPSGRSERLLARGFEGLARLMERLECAEPGLCLPLDGPASLLALTSEGMAGFNARYPQGLPARWGGEGAAEVDGVRYYSWSGTLQTRDDAVLGFDPGHVLCRQLARCFVREAGQNDGLVGRFSSHLGKVIRSDYPFDHLDVINRCGGRREGEGKPLGVYLEHLARLAEAGL
ncbi:esterase/lipase family protein [Azotobacter chroococcum]|uniref:Alpha/beta hydrolase fold protein with lipase active site n=2 Tax=Azotobacter chroococcum TaxID=353 RepID=A0A0C4WQ74_9GAMM|nr:triacylglycerol lipase [Azotobacter chroococcum]AJE22846.1 Alpha/beta hydrolase fold protein with lipase active site [Azotobacter chroococcum NCIMB 8003]ASL27979.1 alpha/beta hydrolase [Azotobacter chroococcum]QQE90983.1 triacylglycerol lipase [Azotobacter chroococcum]TKD38478.1 triacylglycerol lipase [Azotobacter chroococcum]